MKKAISLVLVFVCLLSFTAFAGYVGELTVVNCNSWVSLRSAPSTSASVITHVPRGSVVSAYTYNSEFYSCCYNGQWGYILRGYLDSAGGSSYNYIGTGTVVNCNEFVSLRSSASTSAPRVTTVARNQTVSVYDCGNSSFYYCTYNGMEGYILKQYISVSGGSTYYSSGTTMYVAYCNQWVTLRSAPSTSASTVSRVPLGASVTAYGRTGNFTYVEYCGLGGYILTSYLRY